MHPLRILLGVNIDHIATLRQARGTRYPDPVQAALVAEEAGADGITVHLREDRRHIQERDVRILAEVLNTRMNLEMAVSEEMLALSEEVQPANVCLVPEKREELTTEGGLDVAGDLARITAACERLAVAGCEVSLFIDPEPVQIRAAFEAGAPVILVNNAGTIRRHPAAEHPDAHSEDVRVSMFLGHEVRHGLRIVVVDAGQSRCPRLPDYRAAAGFTQLENGE